MIKVIGVSGRNPSPIAPIAKKLKERIKNLPFHFISFSSLFRDLIENSLPVIVLTNNE